MITQISDINVAKMPIHDIVEHLRVGNKLFTSGEAFEICRVRESQWRVDVRAEKMAS